MGAELHLTLHMYTRHNRLPKWMDAATLQFRSWLSKRCFPNVGTPLGLPFDDVHVTHPGPCRDLRHVVVAPMVARV